MQPVNKIPLREQNNQSAGKSGGKVMRKTGPAVGRTGSRNGGWRGAGKSMK